MNKKMLTVMMALALPPVMWSGGAAASLASGYVVSPPSRAMLCKQGENNKCGDFSIYAADSIMSSSPSTSDFPEDGQLPAGGQKEFQALNAEGAGIWKKTVVDKGQINISWQLTSPSGISSFKYYLTKPNWQETLDSKHHLRRESFDDTPFCEVQTKGELSQGLITHECQLPERHGYQLIYAVAEFGQGSHGQSEHLYNVIDVDIDNAKVDSNAALHTQWNKEIATIDRLVLGKPVAVKVGETVRVRFFSNEGELTSMETRIAILPGEEHLWSYYVAQAINAKYNNIRAGVLREDGMIYPEEGKANSIYVRGSDLLNHAEITFN